MQRNPSAALWKPSENRIKKSNIQRFMNYLSRKHELKFDNYNELYNWSIEHSEKFWSLFWKFSDLISSQTYTKVTNKSIPTIIKIPRPEWFPDAKLNYAENLLRYRDEHVALVLHTEDKPIIKVTYRDLYIKVGKLQKYLISIGVKPNDKIAGLVTNSEEAVIGMLATTSLGAIWTSTSPDFGLQGIVDRFGQVAPKVVISVNAYSYSGKIFDCTSKILEAVNGIKSVEKIIFIENIGINRLPDSEYQSLQFSNLDYKNISNSKVFKNHKIDESNSNSNKVKSKKIDFKFDEYSDADDTDLYFEADYEADYDAEYIDVYLEDQINTEDELTDNKNIDDFVLEYINYEKVIQNVEFDYLEEVHFEQLPFDHPLFIMYSSGTTGAPKCIVHSAGGTLIQHVKELMLHTDLNRDDVIFYFTTCGWMMWNWLVSSLFVGSTLYLYDGNPVYPNIQVLWDAIDSEKITVFGTSPKYLSAVQKSGYIPKENLKLNSLKTILSTGSPLTSENFLWVYDYIKEDLQLSSIAGGTDIISCFMLGNPTLPVYNEEIQCRGLGMKVQAFDEDAIPLENEKGELVCTLPFPSMPIYFLNDPGHKKYFNSYFNTYNGIWRHGDYIKITRSGGVVVYGRSDATLNPGGVRIGTAEIYRIVESLEEVLDSLVVGKQEKGDVNVILFVKIREGFELDEELITKIKNKIRKEATPRHVPFKIIEVNDIPVTMSGKKVEIAVTKLLHNEEVNNLSAIANPECLSQYKNLNL